MPVRIRLVLALAAVFLFTCLFGWLAKQMLDSLVPQEKQVAEARKPRERETVNVSGEINRRELVPPPPPTNQPVESIVAVTPPANVKLPGLPLNLREEATSVAVAVSERSFRAQVDAYGREIIGVRGRIKLEGTPPVSPVIPFDPMCGKLHTAPRTIPFYEVSPEGGFGGVVVYVNPKSARSLPRRQAPASALLDQVGCEYVPYILAVQTGQTLVVRNSDPMMHNVHPMPTTAGNPESNRAQMPMGPLLSFSYPQPELFLKFKCDVHGWMFAYVSVFDHAAFAVTDAEGNYQLPALSPGTYIINALHRKAGQLSQQVTIEPVKQLELNFTFKLKDETQPRPAVPSDTVTAR